MNYFLIFAVTLTLLFSSQVKAESYTCIVKNNGYQTAAVTNKWDNLTINQQVEIIKSWIPKSFTITPEFLNFSSSQAIEIISGDREKSFTGIRRGRYTNGQSYRATYRVNINRYEEKGTVTMQQSGYKDLGPVFFKCSLLKNNTASSPRQSSSNKIAANAFNDLSSCERKYVQQFLKGQGLYNSKIDGKWGLGTLTALKRAKGISAFQGLSYVEMLAKLKRNNPVCN